MSTFEDDEEYESNDTPVEEPKKSGGFGWFIVGILVTLGVVAYLILV